MSLKFFLTFFLISLILSQNLPQKKKTHSQFFDVYLIQKLFLILLKI